MGVPSGERFHGGFTGNPSTGTPGLPSTIKKRSLTIDHTKVPNTDQTNFPVLVSVTDQTLKTSVNGGHVQNINGWDILFCSNLTGTLLLNWEIESYDGLAGTIVAWVQIPMLSHTSDTVFYMFYGNSTITTLQSTATSVWDVNYKGVWHLPNGTTLGLNDSTSNGGVLTNNNGVTAISGKIGGAAGKFNGINQSLSNATSITMVAGSSITISYWENQATADLQVSSAFNLGGGNAFDRIQAHSPWTDKFLYWDYLQNNGSGTGRISADYSSYLDGWSYVTLEYDSSTTTHIIYLNGALANSNISADTPATDRTGFGIGTGVGTFAKASFDEFRVSNNARSADWIKTEYNNQNLPSSFYTLGVEQ